MSEGFHDLHDQRLDYHGDLLPDDLAGFDPFTCFEAWFDAAMAEKAAGRLQEPNAMVVSTVETAGDVLQPSSRVVLLKEWDDRGFVFYTHQTSRKGRALAEFDRTSLLFWWPSLMRQVRVEGVVSPVERAEVEAYFASRPRGSQVGAWASRQSESLGSRAALESAVAEAERRFEGQPVPCPPGWGGYRVTPHRFEFWTGQPSRLHDRVAATRAESGWQVERLNP
ncbi:pyridoxamine 5'-phosphate oxidase [Aestuariimicrobium soli]|uniref:pyridoxamine 5'-phosphate oxidase n=1 Tax=Aestuariimicrobium soli TaxID=2035834 RepID=UPI003EBCF8DE